MTKADIVEKVCEKARLTKKDSVQVVEELFAPIKETLESGAKVKIPGFGNFEVKAKADRRGRNPQTGEEITIEARRILTFKPSPVLKQSINTKSCTWHEDINKNQYGELCHELSLLHYFIPYPHNCCTSFCGAATTYR